MTSALKRMIAELEEFATSLFPEDTFFAMEAIWTGLAAIEKLSLETNQVSASPLLDALCLAIGRQALQDVTTAPLKKCASAARRILYIVSEVYKDGGHTRVLEDLIRLLRDDTHTVLLTYGDEFVGDIRECVRVDTDFAVTKLHGSQYDRLSAGLAFIESFQPDVMIYIGHPTDPVSVALLQPRSDCARLALQINDLGFSLGRFIPGAANICSREEFQRFAIRNWSLDTFRVPLTCPDPGKHRRINILPLTTATCGGSHKFALDVQPSYLDILKARFDAREGRHIHFGQLTEEQSIRISRLGFGDRFVNVPYIPSLAHALHEYAVNLYFDSTSLPGSKAIVEAMAAGVPICIPRRPDAQRDVTFYYEGVLMWRNFSELLVIFSELDEPSLLEHASRSREHYEHNHSAEASKIRLNRIINDLANAS